MLNQIPVFNYDNVYITRIISTSGSENSPQSGRLDMDVSNIGSVGPTQPMKQPVSNQPPAQVANSQPVQRTDEVNISPEAQMLNEMAGSQDMRAERLDQIKAAIADGTYETQEKLNIALDRLLNEINQSNEE